MFIQVSKLILSLSLLSIKKIILLLHFFQLPPQLQIFLFMKNQLIIQSFQILLHFFFFFRSRLNLITPFFFQNFQYFNFLILSFSKLISKLYNNFFMLLFSFIFLLYFISTSIQFFKLFLSQSLHLFYFFSSLTLKIKNFLFSSF